ncbi:hypothetical protein ACFV0L_19975 [Streptosporangium canum]|uniref:hypothetical protein n=1 Tax=Streptosporangium canum TaxID=324952 RepID=UPI00368A5954
MSFLVVSVILLTLAVLANLILTYGVIRRLREHSEMIASSGRRDVSVSVGAQIGAFATTTTRGEPITNDSLGEQTLVAFFSPSCKPCHEKLPSFLKYSSQSSNDTLAVVLTSEKDEAEEMIAQLETTSRVCVDTFDSTISSAFSIVGTPAFVTVSYGSVTANGLPETVATSA